MSIKRRKVDTSLEKHILTGMIVSDLFLREIQNIYHPDLLEISFGTVIAGWCLRHYKKYQKAPRELIGDIFDSWKRSNADSEQVDYIEGFLKTLNDEFEHADKFNDLYALDKAICYFKLRSFKLLSEDLKACADNEDSDEAEKCLNEFRKIEKVNAEGIDVFDDEEAWRSAFDTNTDILFKIPGKLGELLNEQLVRDSFIALMGIAKIGKTWNLQFIAMCAVQARCNVAVFQAGDLSEGQMMVRNGIYISQRSNKQKYCKPLLIPILDCKHNQELTCPCRRRRTNTVGLLDTDGNPLGFDEAEKLGYSACSDCENENWFKGAVWHFRRRSVRPLTWQEAFAEAQAYKRRINAKRYKLSTHPAKSLSVGKIEAILDTWERLEGFIPDVVLIDYADILASENKGNKEERDNINETWMALSALRQKRKICLITATQANGSAIKEKTLSREHYANDRRKYDHCTAMYGLSQTNDEKQKGITRWGAIVLREDNWDTEFQVKVLGCLQIGRPYLNSFV